MPPPAPSGYGPIFDRANELLAGVVAGYSNPKINPTLQDPTLPVDPAAPVVKPITPPSWQFVSDGIETAFPIHEECVVTGLSGVREGFPGIPMARAITDSAGIVVDLSCWVFRLSPLPGDGETEVAPDLVTGSARDIYADMFVVLRSVMLGVEPNVENVAGGTAIFNGVKKASMPEIRSMGPQAGVVGFEVALNVELS